SVRLYQKQQWNNFKTYSWSNTKIVLTNYWNSGVDIGIPDYVPCFGGRISISSISKDFLLNYGVSKVLGKLAVSHKGFGNILNKINSKTIFGKSVFGKKNDEIFNSIVPLVTDWKRYFPSLKPHKTEKPPLELTMFDKMHAAGSMISPQSSGVLNYINDGSVKLTVDEGHFKVENLSGLEKKIITTGHSIWIIPPPNDEPVITGVSSSQTHYGKVNPNGEITIITYHTTPKGVNDIAYTSIVVKDKNNKVYIQDPYKTNNNPASKSKKPIPNNHFGVYPTEKTGYTVRDLIDAGTNGAVRTVPTRYSTILPGTQAKVVGDKLKITLHLKLNNLPLGKKYIYARTVNLQSVDSGWKKVGELTVIENTASPTANSYTQSNKPVSTPPTLRCPSSKQQAYRLYTNNYNELQKLMRQGHGDIPEAQVFYKKYKFYKDCYETPATQLNHDSDGTVSATASDLTATTPILSQTVYASADAYVYAYNYRNWNRSNRGRYDQLVAGWHPTGGESRTYIKFDLSRIDKSKISKAILKLYHFQTSGNNGIELGIFRVTSPWNEGSDTYHSGHTEKTAAPGELSWVQQPQIDIQPLISFNPGRELGDWVEVDITPLVKQWLTGTPNYGLVIKPIGCLTQSIPASGYHFASRERKVDLDNPKGESKAPMLILSKNPSGGNAITQPPQQHHATKATKSTFSCVNKDNEEKGCCCFKGTHTYRFSSRYVANVLARFDTGRRFNCRSTVSLDVDRGNVWETVKTVQANSSREGREVAPTDVLVPVNSAIEGFRISDGCVCCIDSSEITLNADYPGGGLPQPPVFQNVLGEPCGTNREFVRYLLKDCPNQGQVISFISINGSWNLNQDNGYTGIMKVQQGSNGHFT
ncbi:MAG: DNRLRE domain-containing protein, partial [Anaerolineaceae bacterium]|nr:DNRLRE domain-containing protein [Anaerolineaceae bacterium]